MAFNGSGSHNRVHDWTTDLANTVPVTASRMDAEHDDISSSLSNTICRDGQSTTTARIPFAAGTSAAAGTTASVSYSQTNDNNTCLYFPAADQYGLVAGGTATLTSTSAAVTVTATLTVSGAADFGGAVLPTNSDGGALGSATKMWSDAFLASGAVVNWNNGDVTITHSANALAFAGASSGYTFDAAVTITGALSASGDFAIATNKFTVASASGNTVVAGTLGVTSDVAVNTNKFTVAASSGNTAVAGTLAVTGASTLTGALTANNAAGVTAKNTPKAFVSFTTDSGGAITVNTSSAFNVASIAGATVNSQNGFRLTFTSALPSANYAVVAMASSDATANHLCTINSRAADRTTTTFDFIFVNGTSGITRNSVNISLVFFDAA